MAEQTSLGDRQQPTSSHQEVLDVVGNQPDGFAGHAVLCAPVEVAEFPQT